MSSRPALPGFIAGVFLLVLAGIFRIALDQSQVFPWVLAAVGLGLVALSTAVRGTAKPAVKIVRLGRWEALKAGGEC